MKKIVLLIILLSIFALSLTFHNEIADFIIDTVNNFDNDIKTNTPLTPNKYATNKDYMFVKTTRDFSPVSDIDIKNIYYTVMQSGMNDFTFYCNKQYKNCIEDINFISNNQKLLSYINDYVPVYNSFQNIETEFDSLGRIKISIKHNYTEEEINALENKVNEIIASEIKDGMDDKAKIKAIHDYIINNTKYDIERSDNNIIKYRSHIAYGALIEGYGICGGYADSMKIFLDRFDIPNFKVSSDKHTWNAVYLDGKWYHLDLTWDDPVIKNGPDRLDYNYFLIDTAQLLKLEDQQHAFDENIFLELKNN